MEFRTLGANGGTALEVSVVGLGCNAFGGRIDFDATRAVLHAALDAGITLFDTADTYGGGGVSEEYMGRVLGPKRHDIVLASKFGLAVFGGPGGAAPAPAARRQRGGGFSCRGIDECAEALTSLSGGVLTSLSGGVF